MQTFKKRYSQLFLIAFVLISSLYITACDTSEDDSILEEKPQEIEKESTVYTTSDLSSYAIDLPRLLGISQVSDLKLTTPPNFGSVEIIKEGIVLYKANDRNNPKSDQFGYQVNGQNGVVKLEYQPNYADCESQPDYVTTTKNTPIDVYFLSNDFNCMSDSIAEDGKFIKINSIEVYTQDLRNPSGTVEFILYEDNTNTYLNYTPPTDFVGIQEVLYTMRMSDNRIFTSTITFAVLADIDSTGGDTDSTCIFLADDIYNFENLPQYLATSANIVGLANWDSVVVPLHEFYSVYDSIYSFTEGELYVYIPYTENDSLCNPSEWDVTVDWNGIVGGIQILEGNYNPVFFIPRPPLQQTYQIQFFYTLRNRITGEEHTAEILIN